MGGGGGGRGGGGEGLKKRLGLQETGFKQKEHHNTVTVLLIPDQ